MSQNSNDTSSDDLPRRVIPWWRDAIGFLLWTSSIVCGLLAALMLAAGIRWLVLELTERRRPSLSIALLVGGVAAASVCAGIVWLARRADPLDLGPWEGDPDYRPAWDDYRRRVWWYWGEVLGGLVVIAVLAPVLPPGFLLCVPFWVVGVLVATFRLQLFACPRCGRRYFTALWYRNPFARRCVHCGLRKWAEHAPSAREELEDAV